MSAKVTKNCKYLLSFDGWKKVATDTKTEALKINKNKNHKN